MSILGNLFKKREEKKLLRVEKRKFKATEISDLLADWIATHRTINEDLANGQLERLWARAKDLAENNPWFRRFLHLVTQNVLGEAGFQIVLRLSQREGTPPRRIPQEGWLAWTP